MTTSQQRQRVRITKTYVDALKPPAENQTFVRDAELKGFGVRITAGGAIAFIVEKRISGRPTRHTLGQYPAMTVEAARKQAQIWLGQVAEGRNPIAEKRAERVRGITLKEAFEDFKRVRKTLKPRTLYGYGRFMDHAFKDWQARPLSEITKDMIARRHDKLGETSGPAYANLALRFLRSVFNFALAQYETANGLPILPENPVNRLNRTRAWYRVERRRTFLKPHQRAPWYAAVQRLKATAQPSAPDGEPLPGPLDLNHPNAVVADLLVLLLFTGLRREEAASLRWDQIDLLDRTLTLPDPKNREPLVLPLPDNIQDLLEARHAQRLKDHVFPGTGKSGHIHEPKRQLEKVRAWSEVEFILHDLRRTFITTAESLDISAYAIKRLVNHKLSGDVTAGYIGSDTERLRRPMQAIADRLLHDCGIHRDNVVPFAKTTA